MLHAGGVLLPSGRLVLISGEAESGKSTLIAALIQQGCGYLGDEVILPAFRAGAARETARLDVEEAARALLDQTVNMRRIREPGLRAVCDLATHTPVTRITHSDSVDLAAWIVERDATRDQSA